MQSHKRRESGILVPRHEGIRKYSPDDARRWVNRRRPQMSFTPIETVHAIMSGTTIVLTFGTATTSGELIVLHMVVGEDGAIPSSVLDNQAQSYTSIYSTNVGTHWRTSLYYFPNSAAGVTTVTITPSGLDGVGAAIAQHYPGIASTSTLDQNGGTPTSSVSPWSSGTTSTQSQSGNLAIGTCFGQFGTSGSTISAGGSWVQDFEVAQGTWDGNNGQSMAMSHQTLAVTAGIANNGTNTSGGGPNWPGVATFKPASGDTLMPQGWM